LTEVGLKSAVERVQRVRAIMKNGDDPKQCELRHTDASPFRSLIGRSGSEKTFAALCGSQYTGNIRISRHRFRKMGTSTMATAVTARPLLFMALPAGRSARLATQFFMVLAATLLLAVSAKTRVVLGPVDMSLQTLAIFLIATRLRQPSSHRDVAPLHGRGRHRPPRFPGHTGKGLGLAYMVGPTGGYLVGFVAMAAIVGWAADRGFDRSPVRLFAAILTAEVVMMALGFGWLATLIGPDKAWQFGVAPFIVPDLIKVALASALAPAVWSLIAAKR
jgi:biotin transport system substrate-specific component